MPLSDSALMPGRELAGERLAQLVAAALPGARIVGVELLGADAAPTGETSKGAGYGVPLRIDVEQLGARRTLVLHTAAANPYGHDRRSDRAAEVLLAADTFALLPRHVRVLGVGAFEGDDGFVSLAAAGEFYLLTEWGEGQPYAEDLRRIARNATLEAGDRERVDQLAAYLAELHAERITAPHVRERALRDLLGSGEGIFGIIDAYPDATPGVPAERLRRIEGLCCDWRWRMKRIERPAVRTHGDFHPFNVLFDARSELVVLDTSRGSAGEAADDAACMALNFAFFALEREEAWNSALSELWSRFWARYVELSRDPGVFEVAAPFLAWRALVLASPCWYPKLEPDSRSRLLDFVELALVAERFSPELVESLFR
jgi:hypothetical protein